VEWDQKGNPVSVAIATHTEEEYLISHDPIGKKLLNFIRISVQVTGFVEEIAGKKIIKVKDVTRCELIRPK
jgi:hypothetical protein